MVHRLILVSKIVNLYRDKEPLIKLGKDIESLNLPKLTDSLESELSHKGITENEISEVKAKNIFFAASIWPIERCKRISENFFEAIQKYPVICRSYGYGKDKFPTLFTNDVYKHIFENINTEDCSNENSTFQTFRYLCHIQATSKDRLVQFLEKATEKAPVYNHNNPQETQPQVFLKALSDVFAELRYLGRVIPTDKMSQLFDKINHQSSEIKRDNFGRTETKHHSFVSEKASDPVAADIINAFFCNVNLITDGPVIPHSEISKYMLIEANRDKVLDTLIYLKGQGVDISIWANAVINDPRRTDIRRIEILKSAFVLKSLEDTYEVDDNVVKNEVAEFINIIQLKSEGYESLTQMLENILPDERINRLVREVLVSKKVEDLKQLPPSLMQRATESFEQHIQELAIPKDVNVLQIIATNGSDEGIEGVWSIINPILADGKNQNQNNIDGAIRILLSFTRLTNQQADALTGNVKALPANKVTEEKKNDILRYIDDHISEIDDLQH